MTWSTKLEDFHGLSEDSIDGSLSIVPQDFPSQDAAGVFAAIHKTAANPRAVPPRIPPARPFGPRGALVRSAGHR
jgi:hypothetical protein